MCDYSLGGLPNRLAVEGEELVVHRFPTHSMGLAAPADLVSNTSILLTEDQTLWNRIKNFLTFVFSCPNVPAVCVPPGASLILKTIPTDLQKKWNLRAEESVLFIQVSADVNAYRDGFYFANGREVLLQDLSEGMPVKVVSLGGDSQAEQEPADLLPLAAPK